MGKVSQQDQRFQKYQNPDKMTCAMCDGCGLCCLGRDWSTDWMGRRVGICGNLEIKTGSCIDVNKKSIICRNYTCNNITEFMQRIVYILSRDCPTANSLVGQAVGRVVMKLTPDEQEQLMDVMKRNQYKGPDKVPC